VKFPASWMFGAMIASSVLHGTGLIDGGVPPWVRSVALVGIGALIGSRFARMRPKVLLGHINAALGSFAIAIAISGVFVALIALTTQVRFSDVVVAFAPGAMSWANPKLQKREKEAVRNASIPLFLIQASNDYSTGPSEVLGPIIRAKGGLNRATLYPAFGTTHQEGHGGFACWEEGIAIWGNDVLKFLDAAGVGPTR